MVSCEDLQATRSWVVEVLAVQVDAAGKMRNLIPGTDPAKSESKPENGDIDIDIVDEVVDSMPRLKAYVEHAFALAWWTPVDDRDASARLFEEIQQYRSQISEVKPANEIVNVVYAVRVVRPSSANDSTMQSSIAVFGELSGLCAPSIASKDKYTADAAAASMDSCACCVSRLFATQKEMHDDRKILRGRTGSSIRRTLSQASSAGSVDGIESAIEASALTSHERQNELERALADCFVPFDDVSAGDADRALIFCLNPTDLRHDESLSGLRSSRRVVQ